jgi:PEP-CTERM motif
MRGEFKATSNLYLFFSNSIKKFFLWFFTGILFILVLETLTPPSAAYATSYTFNYDLVSNHTHVFNVLVRGLYSDESYTEWVGLTASPWFCNDITSLFTYTREFPDTQDFLGLKEYINPNDYSYYFISVYEDQDGTEGVAILSDIITKGSHWEDYFSVSEENVIALLKTNSIEDLMLFVIPNLFPIHGVRNVLGGTIWDFSEAKEGGSVSIYLNGVAPSPEPSTVLLLGFGLIGLAGVARKKIRR